jgi:hypothetical protein
LVFTSRGFGPGPFAAFFGGAFFAFFAIPDAPCG